MSPISASEREKYPADWQAIRARILLRAGGCCEFTCADGSRCNAPDLEIIDRLRSDPERWRQTVNFDADDCDPVFRQVKVVLTIAHLNHDPTDNRDENLKAGCQLHHLRHDAKLHQAHAAATRRAKKGNGELFT